MTQEQKNQAARLALARINDIVKSGESDPELMAQMLTKVAAIVNCEQCGGAGAYESPDRVRVYRCLECNSFEELAA